MLLFDKSAFWSLLPLGGETNESDLATLREAPKFLLLIFINNFYIK